MLRKDLDIAVLLDFYGDLLTEKQRTLIDWYYNNDLSLGEIAHHQQITRQGVRDSIKRGEKYLLELEQKLELVSSYRVLQQTFQRILTLSEEVYGISNRYKYAHEVMDNAQEICHLVEQQLKQLE